jgi:hypothetical protein
LAFAEAGCWLIQTIENTRTRNGKKRGDLRIDVIGQGSDIDAGFPQALTKMVENW